MHEQMIRLETVREKLNFKNASEFCRHIGFKNRFYYSELLASEKPFPPKYLLNLYNTLEVNLNWFLTGQGPMFIKDIMTETELMEHAYKRIYGSDWRQYWDNRPLKDLSVDELGEHFLDVFSKLSYDEKVSIVFSLIKSTAFQSCSYPGTIIHFMINPLWTHAYNETEIVYKLISTILSISSLTKEDTLRMALINGMGFIASVALMKEENNPEICGFLKSGYSVASAAQLPEKQKKAPQKKK